MAPKKQTKAQKRAAAAARRALAATTEEDSGGHSGEDQTSGSTSGEDNHMVDANREENLANIMENLDVEEAARPAASSSDPAAAAVEPAEKQAENKSKSVERPLASENNGQQKEKLPADTPRHTASSPAKATTTTVVSPSVSSIPEAAAAAATPMTSIPTSPITTPPVPPAETTIAVAAVREAIIILRERQWEVKKGTQLTLQQTLEQHRSSGSWATNLKIREAPTAMGQQVIPTTAAAAVHALSEQRGSA